MDESSEASLNRLKSLINNTHQIGLPDPTRHLITAAALSSSSSLKHDEPLAALAAGSTSLPKFSPTVLQNLQQQFLVHTAMQLGNPNAAQTTQQAIQALQLIQAMLPSNVQASSSSEPASSPQISIGPSQTTPDLFDHGHSGSPLSELALQAPTFSLPLPTPGISAQLAELHALLETNSNGSLVSPPQNGTPGPPSLSTSPNTNVPTPDIPSLSPSTGSTLAGSGGAFAIPNAPVSRAMGSHSALPSAGLNIDTLGKDGSNEFSELMGSPTTGKRPSLSVAIPVDNAYLPQLLALANQRQSTGGAASSTSTASGTSSSSSGATAGSHAAPVAAAAAAAGAAAAASAMDGNKPLLTPGDFLMQQTPGWLPAPSPLGPLMTPGFASTPSTAPFSFPMFSPKQ